MATPTPPCNNFTFGSKGGSDFASKFPSDIVQRVEEMETRARERIQSRIENDGEFLSKTPIQDPCRTRSRQALFTRTATLLFWVTTEFVAIAMNGREIRRKQAIVPKKLLTMMTPALTSRETLLKSSKSSTWCRWLWKDYSMMRKDNTHTNLISLVTPNDL